MLKTLKKNIRFIFLGLIIALGAIIIIFLYIKKTQTHYQSTLAPFFQIMGIPFKTVDRALTVVLPVNSIDEKEYGDIIKKRYESSTDKTCDDYIYLNKLVRYLSKEKRKPFDYQIFIANYDSPNAFAMPGGVIVVTKGLLDTFETEGELASVIAHEIGHIELSHCFDHIRFKLLSEKISMKSAGWLADYAIYLLMNHTFSKTIENEADNYGFEIIKKSVYDPYSTSNAFKKFQEYVEKNYGNDENKHAEILRDYFMSHPPLKIRINEFESKAEIWWKLHPNQKRSFGKDNYKKRIPVF